jgi:hypothetical protein
MSNELHISDDTGLTLYAVRYNSAGEVGLTDGSSFEDWGTGGRDADDYDVAMLEVGSNGYYVGSFDGSANISISGLYTIRVFIQGGSNPIDTDTSIGEGEIPWDGTEEISLLNSILDENGLNSISTSEPSGRSSNFREMVVQLYQRFFNKVTLDNSNLKVYDSGGSVVTTQSASDDGSTQTLGKA